MTPTQLTTLKNAILAETDPTVVAARTQGHINLMVPFYNSPSTFITWRSGVPISEMYGVFVWTEVVALTAGQSGALNLMLAQNTLNPSITNVRTGISAIFASAPGTLAALVALAKRAATNAEKLFCTGTGTNGAPGVLGIEGPFSEHDLTEAWNS